MLEKFARAKEAEINKLLLMQENDALMEPAAIERPSFKNALRKVKDRINLIAEFKCASPSRGIICENANLEEIVNGYEDGGCSAISILTESEYFKGDFSYLDSAWKALKNKNLPILRKDFIFHSLQIRQTAFSNASAVLLIVRAIPEAKKLAEFQEEARKYNLQCVVEIFDENDLRLARESGAEIIQVNARDLNTLKVSRAACLKLAELGKPESGETWIAASGISEPSHLREAEAAGFSACLVGSSLMEKEKPGKALRELLAYAD